MRWWPRTIRWKMLLGLVLLEALSIALFALLLIRLQETGCETPRPGEAAKPGDLGGIAGPGSDARRPDWTGWAWRCG